MFVGFDSDGAEVIRNLGSVGIKLDRHVKSGVLRMISARTITGSAETLLVRVKAAGTVDVGTLKPEPRTQQNQLGRLRWTISNAEGAAVTGAQVECWLPEASLPTATVVTGADGSFSVSLASAAWRLEISHPYYQAKTVLDVSVAEGTDVDRRAEPIVLSIRPATITGVVMKERDGLTPVPAEGAVVSLTGSSSTAVANAAGEFTLSGVVAGAEEVGSGGGTTSAEAERPP